jgi:hypothetical protein
MEPVMFQNSTINPSGSTTNNTLYSYGKFSGLCHRYHRLLGLYATGTKEVFSGDSYAALQNQVIQTNTFGIPNNASVQTLQDIQRFEEIVTSNPLRLRAPGNVLSILWRSTFPWRGQCSPGPVAVPATMGWQ